MTMGSEQQGTCETCTFLAIFVLLKYPLVSSWYLPLPLPCFWLLFDSVPTIDTVDNRYKRDQ